MEEETTTKNRSEMFWHFTQFALEIVISLILLHAHEWYSVDRKKNSVNFLFSLFEFNISNFKNVYSHEFEMFSPFSLVR